MNYHAIIFDFNGVLLLDREWHEEAWSMISQQLRGEPLSGDEANEHMHGRTPDETFKYLSPDASKEELIRLNLQKEHEYQQNALSKGPQFCLSPGAEELFDLLKANGIKFTIATSSPLMNVDFFFKYLHLEKWFDRDLVVYDDGSYASKPAPDMYLEAARRLGVNIGECLVVEDSSSGIQSAINAKAGKVIQYDHNAGNIPGVTKVVDTLAEITLADFE